MGGSWALLVGAIVSAGGCALFDDGGDAHQIAAAKATADGLIAFSDINNNLTTDTTAAGAAVQKFLTTPVAAHELVAPPFDFGEGATLESVRTVVPPPADLPGCVATTGVSGCDSFQANDCNAGTLAFGGTGSRMCPGCPTNDPNMVDVFGECMYAWNMNVGLTTDAFTLQIDNTTGSATVSSSEVGTTRVRFDYTLQTQTAEQSGSIEVCACGPLTTDAGPPRRLVEGQFLVRAFTFDVATSKNVASGCSVVTFTNNEPAADACDFGEPNGQCPNGTCQVE